MQGRGGNELPIHHGVSVQGHEENLAAASWPDRGKEHLQTEERVSLYSRKGENGYNLHSVFVIILNLSSNHKKNGVTWN